MAETPSNVRIHGKSQSRTVLGIVNAYLVMHPESTIDDLRKAFPSNVTHKFAKWGEDNPDPLRREGLFHVIETKDGKRFWKATGDPVVATTTVFEQEDETIHLSDGTEVAMESTWVAEDYRAMVDWARQYGIEIASFEKADGGFVKGSFSLEYLHGFAPKESRISQSAPIYSAPTPKTADEPGNGKEDDGSKKTASIWPLIAAVLLALLLVALILWLHSFCACHQAVRKSTEATEAVCAKTESEESVANENALPRDTSVAVVEDTVRQVQKAVVACVQKNFNAIKFPKGKASLNAEMKKALASLVETLKSNPDMRIKVSGHSSSDGEPAFNQRLSEQRARVIVDYIASQGVERERLEYEGRGSSDPISDKPEENRRTEITVL